MHCVNVGIIYHSKQTGAYADHCFVTRNKQKSKEILPTLENEGRELA